MAAITRFLRAFFVIFIRIYQLFISPVMANRCRFYPSCSQYACDAITHRGIFLGGSLAVWRLLRCNPWNHGGYDPVPTHAKRNEKSL